MPRVPSRLAFLLLLVCAVEPVRAIRQAPGVYDIRSFGARGDGKSVDSDAINKAVEAAAAAGGGIVDLPAGRYLSFSIRLKSHVTLRFSPGAVLVAGDPASMFGTLPAFRFYVRHAQGISMRDIVISTMTPDHRPPWLFHDARNVMLDHVEAPRHGSSPFAVLRDVADLSVRNVIGVADGRHARIPAGTLPYGQQ